MNKIIILIDEKSKELITNKGEKVITTHDEAVFAVGKLKSRESTHVYTTDLTLLTKDWAHAEVYVMVDGVEHKLRPGELIDGTPEIISRNTDLLKMLLNEEFYWYSSDLFKEKTSRLGDKLQSEVGSGTIHTSLDYVDVPLARSIENDIVDAGVVPTDLIIQYVTAVMFAIKHGESIVARRIADGEYRHDMIQTYYDHINSYEYEECSSLYELYYTAMKSFFRHHIESENGMIIPNEYIGFEMPDFMSAYNIATVYHFDEMVKNSYAFTDEQETTDIYKDLFIIRGCPMAYENMPFWLNSFLFTFLSDAFPEKLEF